MKQIKDLQFLKLRQVRIRLAWATHTRTRSGCVRSMSAFGGKADITQRCRRCPHDPKRTSELACAQAFIMPTDRDLRTGIWIWDASGVCGFVMFLAGV